MRLKSEFCRDQAKRMRAIAKRAPKELRDELLAVAREYDRLADEVGPEVNPP